MQSPKCYQGTNILESFLILPYPGQVEI